MNWITKIIKAGEKIKTAFHERASKEDIAKSDWTSCCRGPILKKDLEQNLWVCPDCNKHHRIKPSQRFDILFGKNNYEVFKTPIPKDDPLNWTDSQSYKDRLKAARKKTGMECGMMVACGTINNIKITAVASDFDFLGASMAAAEGEAFLFGIQHAIENKTLRKENLKLKRKVAQKYNIIGESEEVIKMKEMISKVAPTDARVLITGENGTGKELAAHQLHQQSERSKENFIEVNCAAIPSELIESELFGHVKGAFTSAVKDRSGKFEAANKGTLFLDEIADMSLAAQAKVLRALQEKKIQRVGNEKDISVDVRVVAATNKDLLNEIKAGRFREDLYHRLAVIMIHVPSLDDRKEDIPLLVSHFVDLLSKEQGLEKKSFSEGAYAKLDAYPWTGNVRELRNVVERLLILGENPISADNIVQFAPK